MPAVKRKDENAIKLLVARGADAEIGNNDGIFARTIAESKGPKRLLALFA